MAARYGAKGEKAYVVIWSDAAGKAQAKAFATKGQRAPEDPQFALGFLKALTERGVDARMEETILP